MTVDYSFLKVVHEQQLEMIEILELFEDVLLDANYQDKWQAGNQEISSLFRKVENLIARHLAFETDHLLPLLDKSGSGLVMQRLLKQRELILTHLAKMTCLIRELQVSDLGVCVWDDFVDTALSLVRATFALFHWEELEFLPCFRKC